MSELTKAWELQMSRNNTRGTIDVGNVRVSVSFVDCINGEQAFGDKSRFGRTHHNRYRVNIVNKDTDERAWFHFHDSAHNTQTKDLFPADLGYSILCCIRSDFHYSEDNYPTFEDFAKEFGYDEDSRQHERTYKACLKLAAKLNKVFNRELIETLPQ